MAIRGGTTRMTTTKERQALTYEIKARENLLKRLEYPRKQLESAVKKEDEQRQTIIKKAAEFSSVEDAREMWGYGFITDDEFEMVKQYFENSAALTDKPSASRYALQMLQEIMERLRFEVNSFKFDLLPEDEQTRYFEAQEKKLSAAEQTTQNKVPAINDRE